MHILRLNISDIEVQHLDELVANGARESEALEFKATLPFKPQKGQPEKADRWIEKGDYVGRYARDRVLAEMVAFANASGGTLVIGVEENNDQPRRAIGLSALPACDKLAQLFLDMAEEVIEPRLPSLIARGIPIDDSGQGYVILRAGRSRVGPHRLKGDEREFYIRRGERAARMDVREIKNLTLELARSDERLDVTFDNRRKLASEKFRSIPRPDLPQGEHALLARVTALPVLAEQLEELTRRPELWWTGSAFEVKFAKNRAYPCNFPAQLFGDPPRIELRQLICADDTLSRVLRSDGLVEAVLMSSAEPRHAGRSHVYVSWFLSLLVGVLAQIEHLRRELAWDAVEYGLEVEFWIDASVGLRWTNKELFTGPVIKSTRPLTFPKYSIRGSDTFDEIVTLFLRDLLNACGKNFDDNASVDWDQLLKR